MSKHTPGPWALGGYKDREIKHPFFHNNSNPLARVYARLGDRSTDGTHAWRDAEADANAQLIATAPELLEVAQRALEWADVMGGWESPVWDDLKAVVAKATGELEASSSSLAEMTTEELTKQVNRKPAVPHGILKGESA